MLPMRGCFYFLLLWLSPRSVHQWTDNGSCFLHRQRSSEEPEYEYGNGEDGLVMGDVTMDDAGVSLLTIDARDGSVIQRVQAGWAVFTGNN